MNTGNLLQRQAAVALVERSACSAAFFAQVADEPAQHRYYRMPVSPLFVGLTTGS
jgi:hypothetical protein